MSKPITLKWLQAHGACEDGIRWATRFGLLGIQLCGDAMRSKLAIAMAHASDPKGAGFLIWAIDEIWHAPPDLDGVNLRGADLSHAFLRGARLRGADLRGATLHDADLFRADLRGADLRGARFTNADLERANMDEARIDRASFEFADLTDTGLPTDCSGAYLFGALRENEIPDGWEAVSGTLRRRLT